MYKKYEMFVKLYIPNPKESPSGQDKFENRKRYKGNFSHKSNCLFLKNNPKTCKLYITFRCHQPRKRCMSRTYYFLYFSICLWYVCVLLLY